MGRGRQAWTRRYPPLLGVLAAALIAGFVLPSALNVPQRNPSQTLEFAPVPPDEDRPPPPHGNVSSLGLGSSAGPAADAPGGASGPDRPPPPLPSGTGEAPVTKRCVGDPPRQTEDPMSPPCVAHFEGDNGGATYQGVTDDEITVLFLPCANCLNEDDGTYSHEPGAYCDVEAAPHSDPGCSAGAYPSGTPTGRDNWQITVVRALANHFNARFQTYGRRVHLHAYWPEPAPSTSPETRRAEAADNLKTLRPFAVIDRINLNPGGYRDVYATAMAAGGTLNFLNFDPQPRALFQRFPAMMWHLFPDVERWAQTYVDYVCTRVAGFPVSHAEGGTDQTGAAFNGRQRRYGLVWMDDPARPHYRAFADLVRDGLAACGVVAHDEAAVPEQPSVEQGVSLGASFRQQGITTVLYLASYPAASSLTRGFNAAGYYPELVVAGDGYIDRGSIGQLNDQNVWRNAWTVTPFQLREDEADTTPGFRACQEGDPTMTRAEMIPYCQFYYRDLFLLFQAIQIAGPNLTPGSVDRGFRAIPPVESTDPYRASCYFDPGDYTCVKDAMEEWWDPEGQSPQDTAPGCWRMVDEGRRHWIGTWEREDTVFDDRGDPCNGAGAFFAR